MSDSIDVYWATGNFSDQEQQWNLLYREPEQVYLHEVGKNKKQNQLKSCPAHRNVASKLYALKSNIDDKHNFTDQLLSENQNAAGTILPSNGKVALQVIRPPISDNYANIIYNLSWLFIASESLEMKMTAPYFPATTPTKDAKLTFGQFDIGNWYRNVNLEYLIPLEAKEFVVKKGESLAYVEFLTEKKINLIPFVFTERIKKLQQEFVTGQNHIHRGFPLKQRYQLAKTSNIRNIMLTEVRKNVVETFD